MAQRSRWGISAFVYLVHLALPAFLAADVAIARLRHEIVLGPTNMDAAVGAVSAVWLAAGLGVFFFSRDRGAFLQRVATPLTAIYAVYFGAFLMEGCVRLAGFMPPSATLGTPWKPFINAVTTMNPKETPGVSGPKRFTTNAMGLRGPMPPRDRSAYGIVAIGASTTICTNLDDSEEWPHLVMEKLNASSAGQKVWVTNAGFSAANTVHHLVLMQLLPGLLHVDMAIFLIGGNDMGATVAMEGNPTQAVLEKQAGFQGDLPKGTHWRKLTVYPVYRRLGFFVMFRLAAENLKLRLKRPSHLGSAFTEFDARRRQRAASPVLPLPDLSVGLKEYRSRIFSIAARCEDLKVRCLFLTQPTMWRDNLTASEERLLWQGYIGRLEDPKGYVSAGELARAMDMYNRTLLDVCRQQGLECLDMAARIPKDTAAFFDDCHFNESGARMVAENLTEYLLARSPFSARKR